MSVAIRRWEEFGSQQLASPPSPLRPDLVVVRNKAKRRDYTMVYDRITVLHFIAKVYHTLNCEAFSINYADICIRWGLYESALRYVGWPIIPGFDIAGRSMKSFCKHETWGTNGTLRKCDVFFPYVFQVRLRWRVQSLAFRWEIASLVVAFLELMPPEAQLNMCRSCNPNTCFSKQWCNHQ